MSEFINNREYRQKVIKDILAQLHEGKSVDDVKAQFEAAFDGVSADEISQAEQALMQSGMPVSEIQRLCDVHAEVFKGSITEIHEMKPLSELPGHPAHTLHRENRAIEALIEEIRGMKNAYERSAALARLYEGLDIHYKKKENLFFPYIEQKGITAPPKVMWGVDDEIRSQLKALSDFSGNELELKMEEAFTKINDMIFKEENILLQILFENLSVEDWKKVADESEEYGYCLISDVPLWQPPADDEKTPAPQEPAIDKGEIRLPTGVLSVKELTLLLNALPIDITFVGKDDTVRYFSQSNERIFPRTTAIIGRDVSNCHPPASVHIVENIVADFKSGAKDNEDFWIKMGDKYILIRYFAVRDEQGEYLGVLEVTQNIAPIQQITGEKRLASE
ncbi:MAG: DUF438 domain-containing protein [Christensenellales bacterium]|jgi:DUF438 domain-containing protein